MRLIYRTPPVAASLDVSRGQNVSGKMAGYVTFRVYLCDPGEELPPGHQAGRPLSWHRARAGGPGKPIVIHQSAYSLLASVTPTSITVPESVLAGLPDDALLRFTWFFGPKDVSSNEVPRT